jgi:hypothetical protein
VARTKLPAGKKAKKKRAPSEGMPPFVVPQLCASVERPPAGGDWIHEIKFDGYRIQMRVEKSDNHQCGRHAETFCSVKLPKWRCGCQRKFAPVRDVTADSALRERISQADRRSYRRRLPKTTPIMKATASPARGACRTLAARTSSGMPGFFAVTTASLRRCAVVWTPSITCWTVDGPSGAMKSSVMSIILMVSRLPVRSVRVGFLPFVRIRLFCTPALLIFGITLPRRVRLGGRTPIRALAGAVITGAGVEFHTQSIFEHPEAAARNACDFFNAAKRNGPDKAPRAAVRSVPTGRTWHATKPNRPSGFRSYRARVP